MNRGSVEEKTGRRVIPVRNPWSGEYDYQITPPTDEELKALCNTLRRNQKGWAQAGLEKRIEVMLRWADELEKAKGRLIEADSIDTGYCIISKAKPRHRHPLHSWLVSGCPASFERSPPAGAIHCLAQHALPLPICSLSPLGGDQPLECAFNAFHAGCHSCFTGRLCSGD